MLPAELDPAYADHVTRIYKAPAFSWNPRYYELDPARRQLLVDTVREAGGRIGMTDLLLKLEGTGIDHLRVGALSRQQQCGDAPVWEACLVRVATGPKPRLGPGDHWRWFRARTAERRPRGCCGHPRPLTACCVTIATNARPRIPHLPIGLFRVARADPPRPFRVPSRRLAGRIEVPHVNLVAPSDRPGTVGRPLSRRLRWTQPGHPPRNSFGGD